MIALGPVKGWISETLFLARTFARAGMLKPSRPDRVARVGLALQRFGTTLAAGYMGAAARHPNRRAIVDELGAVTFATAHRRTNALANGFATRGVGEGDGVAIMCRNHRGFIEASLACSKLGAHALYLGTAFAAPLVSAVLEREDPVAVVYDQEFAATVDAACEGRRAFVAWVDDRAGCAHPSLEEVISSADDTRPPPPAQPGRTVILTSGTTGPTQGRKPRQPGVAGTGGWPALAHSSPGRGHHRDRRSPVSCLGFAHMFLSTPLGSTLALTRRFDPEGTLRVISDQRADALIVVPVMLQRILELPDEVLERYDTSSLRVIAVSGSALSGALARRAMDRLGDVVYNLYGSTEVAWATIADPVDLRSAPGTAGRAPRGTTVKILDDHHQELPTGESGEIFVGSELLFEGYTGGADKPRFGALMSTGDVGHFDASGRLFIDGREDDMIVSGGENVYPGEVEELLEEMPGVRETAVVGVEDEQWGQRLRAFVALSDGASLGEETVKEHIKANLAGYKVPRDVVFVDELPRNATGKVLKRELRARD